MSFGGLRDRAALQLRSARPPYDLSRKYGSTAPLSLMVSGLPWRSLPLPASTRIQPSLTQYSATLVFSTPLKRTPMSRSSSFSMKKIDAALDARKGENAWLTVSLREGRNREIRRVMAHLGLDVTRLIRIAYGPFQLGTLPRGGIEEVPTRVLREQLPKAGAAERPGKRPR